MAVDPEGRFLFLAARNSPRVYRLTLAEDHTPSLLYDDTSLTGLKPSSTIDVRQHETYGRVFRIISWATQVGAQNLFFLLRDANNDGIVDSETSLTETQYQSSEYPANWTEDFVFYTFASAE